jgi:hypothetical protein
MRHNNKLIRRSFERYYLQFQRAWSSIGWVSVSMKAASDQKDWTYGIINGSFSAVEIVAVSRCNMIYLFFSRFLTRKQSLWSVGEHEEVQGTLGRITRTTAVCCIASRFSDSRPASFLKRAPIATSFLSKPHLIRIFSRH